MCIPNIAVRHSYESHVSVSHRALFVKFVVKFVNVLLFISTVISHFLCVTDTHNRAKSLVLFHQISLMNFRASHSGITKELVTEASQVFPL